MKKLIFLTFVLSILLFSIGTVKAQWSLSNYMLQNTVSDTSEIDAFITIENHGSNTLYLQVERTIQYLVANTEESFCFGPNCYTPGTSISIDPAIIAPGDSDRHFHIIILPHGTCGTSYIHYRIFNQNNISDSLGIDMSFGFCTATGISESSSSYGVSRPTHNPADGFTSFNYQLNDNNGHTHIAVYNMLGSLIKLVPITEKSGELLINTSDLKSGLYLCSVVNNNKVTNTYKLVVAHK